MIRVVHPGSGSLLFTHPGSRIRIRNRNTALDRGIHLHLTILFLQNFVRHNCYIRRYLRSDYFTVTHYLAHF
jgi:hypothetical protein